MRLENCDCLLSRPTRPALFQESRNALVRVLREGIPGHHVLGKGIGSRRVEIDLRIVGLLANRINEIFSGFHAVGEILSLSHLVSRNFPRLALMPESLSKRRVLVVDDEKNIADSLVLIMRSHGFESIAVYSGEAAVEAAVRFLPDVLISDVIMSEMSGIEAAIHISKALPRCKIILFSGQAATADLISPAGFDACRFEILSKPVHPQVLVDRINSLAPFAPDQPFRFPEYKSAIRS